MPGRNLSSTAAAFTVIVLTLSSQGAGQASNARCETADSVLGGASTDLYCMDLVATPGLDGAQARVVLNHVASPFGVAVNRAGNHVYGLTFTIEGLPPAATLGDYTTYVAWLTTPLLFPTVKLGEVRNGTTQMQDVDYDKFLILISAERSADDDEREGRLVFRGGSPSTRMSPPDLLEFLIGATSNDTNTTGHTHAAMAPNGWPRPPMPSGIAMLPALMQLEPPKATPFLPRGDGADVIPLARPRQVIRMVDGDTVDLEASFVRRTINGRTFVMYGFNGQYPGPLFWIPQNATIHVNFTNNIEWPTAVHWHGVRLENAFDGVPGVTQEPVQPGETFYYRIHFRDAGIYWYHPHHREDVQQDLGLYGNMLVRSTRLDYFSPAHHEEVLMLDDILIGDSTIIPYGQERATHTLMGRFGNIYLTNGEPEYDLSIDRGAVVRLFLTNVSNTRTFNLSMEGADVKAVGSDVGNFEREQWVDHVVIAPAERYIVHARYAESGTYALTNRVRGIDHLNGRFFSEVDTLGLVHVSANEATPDLAASFSTLREDRFTQEEIDRYRPLIDKPIDRQIVLTLETDSMPFVVERLMQFDSAYFNPVEWSGTMPMMNWASTPERVRWIIRDADSGRENMDIGWNFAVGDVVKIRLTNEREAFHAMQHPVHIHGQRFLVVARNGIRNTNMAWKDTVLLPVGGTADILLEVSNPGRWMVHCHIAEHLESGMKFVFEVQSP